jgi:sugar/nucleoside kinase (ribokinase family)
MSEILVVGSLAYDSIKSPEGEVPKSLGGAANFFSVAASNYSPVRVVGVVGDDYTDADFEVLKSRKNIDIKGIQKVSGGKTFFWQGAYEGDLSEAITLKTDLNVFEHFNPELPTEYTTSSHVFLANIDPSLQLKVLDQVKNPKLIGADSMNLWINIKKEILQKMISRVNMLFINEGEAKLLTGKSNAIAATGDILKMGPSVVVIKRGEYGSVICSNEGLAILPAFPVPRVFDPTGAGDSFAGAFFGYLCQQEKHDFATLKRAAVHGTVMASFTVEKFGMTRLNEVTPAELESRRKQLLEVCSFS